MTHGQAVARVTRWEFRRFLRIRELISTVVLTAALGAGIPLLIGYSSERAATRIVTVAVPQEAPLADAGRFEFLRLDGEAALAALQDGEVDAVLQLPPASAPVLVTAGNAGWAGELEALLTEIAVAGRLGAAGLDGDELAAILAPVELTVTRADGQSNRGTGVVMVVVGIVIFALFVGMGLLFTAITGEKTQRVTEQIISAVSPQAWIDGKVLGTALYVLVNMVAFGIGIALAIVIPGLVRGQGLPELPQVATEPMMLVATIVFALLGLALYFLLFAAVAATIDDPATSQRSGLIMVPGALLGLGFLGLLGDSANALFVTLSYIPLTSPSAMPVRMMLGEASTAEVLASLALLAAFVVLARSLAGRVFALGILMTGKEPSWREIMHWFRRT